MKMLLNPDKEQLNYQFLHMLTAGIVILFVTANIITVRSLLVFDFSVNCCYLIFPIIFCFLFHLKDIYKELYISNIALLILLCSVIAFIAIRISLALPAPDFWLLEGAYQIVFGQYAKEFFFINFVFFTSIIIGLNIQANVKKYSAQLGFNIDPSLAASLISMLFLHYMLSVLMNNVSLSEEAVRVVFFKVILLGFFYTWAINGITSKIIKKIGNLELRSYEKSKIKENQQHLHFRCYIPVAVFFTLFFILSKIIAAKFTYLYGVIFNVGGIVFPLSYIFSDILTEVYGFKRARRLIWFTIGLNVGFLLILLIVNSIPTIDPQSKQLAFKQVFSTQFRIIIASAISFWIGDFINCYVIAKLKLIYKNSFIGFRFVTSTALGTLVDVSTFTFIAYLGVVPFNKLAWVILCENLFKIGYELMMAPISVRICNILKFIEKVDIYDVNTNFSPFNFDIDYDSYENNFNDRKEEKHDEDT